MIKSALNYKQLNTLISEGKLDRVINNLLQYIEGVDTNVTKEIYLTSARFRSLELEKISKTIDLEDYRIERNSITASLIEIIHALKETTPAALKEVPSPARIKAEIEELVEQFNRADNIKSLPSRLRTKIHTARKIADKLILWPDLMNSYYGTDEIAIICGIGRKVKAVSNIEDLDILESITPKATTNVSKGFIINALAELVYSGQLRIGDDARLRDLLNIMNKDNDDRVVMTNIQRVEAILDVLTGVHQFKT